MIGIIIVSSFTPKYLELELIFTITEQIIPHVPCLGFVKGNVGIGKVACGGVICFKWGRWFRVSEMCEDLEHRNK